MAKSTFDVGAILLITLAAVGTAMAEIPEPDHIFWGKATYFGEELTEGEITVTVNDDPQVLATYALGSMPEIGPQFVLRVPLDSLGPRLPSTARRGDLARFYSDGELAGQEIIGDRGSDTKLDIDPEAVSFQVVDVGDAQLVEGDSGQQEMVFTVTLSEAVDFDVTVNYTTADGTATVADADYQPENGAVDLNAGDTEATLSITVNGDTAIESDETFVVNLTQSACSGQQGCTPPSLGDTQGTGTILDDDTPPSISISDVTVAEGESTVQAVFRISLSHVWDQDVSADFATAPGSAEAGTDYLSNSGTVSVLQGSLVNTVAVDVLPDAEDEDDETFFVNLSNPVNGSLLDAQGIGTILDDQNFLIYRGQQKEGVAGVQGLDGVWGVAESADGDHVYAVSETDALVIFERDPVSGDLVYQETLRDGVNGIDGLDGARDVTVSRDGLYVYVVSAADQAVAVFARNADDSDPGYGGLTLVQVLANDDIQDSLTVDGLVDARRLLLSPDPDGAGPEPADSHLYVVGKGGNTVGADVGSVAAFVRDAISGELTFLEVEVHGVDDASDFGPVVAGLLGASDAAVSADGAHLYATGELDGAVAVFERENDSSEPTLFGRLTYLESYSNGVGSPAVTGIEGASSVELSDDGRHVYVTGRGADGGVALFERGTSEGEAGFGKLQFVEAVAATTGNGLLDVVDAALSTDNRYLYSAAFSGGKLSVFRREDTGVLTFIEVKGDGVGGVDGLGGAKRLAVTGNDRHVYATGNYDDAAAIFVRDMDPPNDPTTLFSTTHQAGVWSGNPVIVVQWSGASDNGHAGVAGYSFLFDNQPSTLPDAVVDLEHDVDPHSTFSAAAVVDSNWYFHIRTCDTAENCTSTRHIGPFQIDVSPPADPTVVVSDSHVVGEVSSDTRITMRWNGADDASSGLGGYGYTFQLVSPGSPNPGPLCDRVRDVLHVPGNNVVESPPLFNGHYFFQLCTQDAVGNWSSGIVPIGPFVIQSSDADPPAVAGLNTVASAVDLSLDDDESLYPTVTQILVEFDEPMFQSAMPGTPGSVNDPSNYAVVADGDDGAPATAGCDVVGGDDEAVAIDEVLYDVTSFTAALKLNGGFSLPVDGYRLIVCDELMDPSGNHLDGDADGSAGGDLVLDFEVTTINLLLNPNLDPGDLSFWIDTPEGTPDVSPGVGIDVGGAFSSNSVSAVADGSSLGTVFGVSQCVPFVLPTLEFELSGWMWLEPDDDFAPTGVGTVKFYTDTLCDGSLTGVEQRTEEIGDTEGLWSMLSLEGEAPADAQSALVSFIVQRAESPVAETFEAGFDDLYFGTVREGFGPLFADDFESGDLSGWSAHVP